MSLATGLHFWWPSMGSHRTAESMKTMAKKKRQTGYSTLEMLVVVAMSLVITAIAVPGYVKVTAYLRAISDLRAVNGITAQAKMRAAADFTHARIYANLTANTYHLELWNKAGNGGAGCWQTDGDTNACTANGSPVIKLSTGVTFGTGSVTAGPTVGTATVAQAAVCNTKAAGISGNGTTASTACVEFNSRGIPVDSTNAPVATGAIYINNANQVEVVTVSATGSIQPWLATPTCNAASCWHGQ